MKTAEKINERLTISKSLPSPPQVLLKLLEACGTSGTTPGELAKIVFKDPSISAKILQLINSSFTGIRKKVNDLERAIVYLGADTIKNVAISASVVQTFGKTESGDQFNMHHFWWHSVMCGTLAKRIAGKAGYSATDEAFLSGMLHDIGKLVLWVNHKERYTDALRDAGKDPQRLIEKETEIGAAHHELGAWMVRQWRLNSLMADAIYYHHDELSRVADALPLVKIVYLANILSQMEDQDEDEIRAIGKKLFDLTPEQMGDILEGARDEVADMAESLGIPATPPPAPVSQSPPEADIRDQGRLVDTIKHHSLMYGTLQNLLSAHSLEEILKTASRGFSILFGIQRLLFFLHDTDRNCLRAHSASAFFGKDTAQSLVIPVSGSQGALARCFVSGRRMDTFHQPGDLPLSIADEQILRLLGTDGILYMPMITDGEPVGVIIAGLSQRQAREMEKHRQLLDLFVNHTGMCLFVHAIRQAQDRRLQAERLEASITMARKVVHEVNNPLGIIKNYLRILGLKLPEKHPAQAELGVISEEIDRVGQIVRSLKDYATPMVQHQEKVDLNQLLKNILAIMDNSILKPAMISLEFSPDPTLPKIRTEKNSIKQVIINLVKNAAEALPEEGAIQVATRYNHGGETTPEQNGPAPDTLTIVVKDTGPGLPEEIRQHLFEPFHSSGKKGHSGLGLSIVHNIIGRLGGNISCKTSSQKGTVFIITLPITSNATTESRGE